MGGSWGLPVEGASGAWLPTVYRCTPEARPRVYRTRDAPESWEPLTRGPPQEGVFEGVLRDGMDSDMGEPGGIYSGTRSGKLFAPAHHGDSWALLHGGLPPVVCVKAVLLR